MLSFGVLEIFSSLFIIKKKHKTTVAFHICSTLATFVLICIRIQTLALQPLLVLCSYDKSHNSYDKSHNSYF
jgi:O-antigen/teichoic acid export membrane protein